MLLPLPVGSEPERNNMAKYLNERGKVAKEIEKAEDILRAAGISFSLSLMHVDGKTFSLVDTDNGEAFSEFPRIYDSQRFRLCE